MSYTSLGEFLRILRIKNHEVMGDLAKVLGTSSPFLSAVENGKKNIPTEWIPKIISHYNLSEEDQERLRDAIEESKTQYKIVVSNSGINQRKAAMQFARSFDDMDDETALYILDLLQNKENKNK